MPSLQEININNKKKFKKREYRAWNLEGKDIDSTTLQNHNTLPIISQHNTEVVYFLNCKEIKNWELHDRPINELGDIEALAEEFKKIGQHQPCIVRPIEDKNYKYELIAGERRWRAASLAEMPVKALVQNLTDYEAAILQSSENSSRKGLSEFARGMSYHNLVERGVLTQTDLVEKLKLSKQQISRLLSFAKIHPKVIDAIQNFYLISSGTAEKIKQLCDKGELYIQALIHYAPLLRDGSVGHKKLEILVDKHINPANRIQKTSLKVYTNNGRLLFTWRKEKNSYLSIHFPKDLTSLIDCDKLRQEEIDNCLKTFIEEKLMTI